MRFVITEVSTHMDDPDEQPSIKTSQWFDVGDVFVESVVPEKYANAGDEVVKVFHADKDRGVSYTGKKLFFDHFVKTGVVKFEECK